MQRKNVLRLVGFMALVILLVSCLVGCGEIRLKYTSLCQTMTKLGYKYEEYVPSEAPYVSTFDEELMNQVDKVVLFYGSSIPEKKDNEALVFYARTSEAAEAINKAVKDDEVFVDFSVYRSGRVIVYANQGGLEDVRGY